MGAPRTQAHLLAAVVEYRTPHRRLKRGLATGWLARLRAHPTLPQAHPRAPAPARAARRASGCARPARAPTHSARPSMRPPPLPSCSFKEYQPAGALTPRGRVAPKRASAHRRARGRQVPVWVERGVLRLPPPGVPLLLVGPGTGVAPFRAFLEERAEAAAAGAALRKGLGFCLGAQSNRRARQGGRSRCDPAEGLCFCLGPDPWRSAPRRRRLVRLCLERELYCARPASLSHAPRREGWRSSAAG